jgi:hypothetical protein
MEPTTDLTPITRAMALEAGMTPWQWRSLIESGSLERIRRGVYARVRARDDRAIHAQRVAAELLLRTDHFAVSTSAVALLGLPNPYFELWQKLPVQLAGPKSRPDRGVRRIDAAPIPTPWGPSTDLIDTAVLVAAELPLPQALMVTDAVARRLAGTTDRFVLASEPCRTEVRRRLTRNHDLPALRLANPAAESPAESFYRGHMILQGYTDPPCGVPRRGASGKQYFIDILLERLAIEIDGLVKYTDLDALRHEKTREDDLRAAGHDFLRVWADELFADPAQQMRNLADKLERMRQSRLAVAWR